MSTRALVHFMLDKETDANKAGNHNLSIVIILTSTIESGSVLD